MESGGYFHHGLSHGPGGAVQVALPKKPVSLHLPLIPPITILLPLHLAPHLPLIMIQLFAPAPAPAFDHAPTPASALTPNLNHALSPALTMLLPFPLPLILPLPMH